jgi:HMG-box domain
MTFVVKKRNASLTDRIKLDVKRHSRIYTDDFRTLLSIDDGAATTAAVSTSPNPTTDATNADVVSRSTATTDDPRRIVVFPKMILEEKKCPKCRFHRCSLPSYHPQLQQQQQQQQQQQPQVQSMMQHPQQVHHLMPSSNASSTPNRDHHHHPSHQQQQHSHPPKEMNKPKGRMSAYTFFVQKCRDEHRKAYPNENANFSEFSKKCAEKWKVSVECDLDIDGRRQCLTNESYLLYSST